MSTLELESIKMPFFSWSCQCSRTSSMRKNVMKAFEEESDIQAELQVCCRVEVWMRDRLESMH